jgi:hypothetical protein
VSFGDTVFASGFKGKLMFDVMVWFGDGKPHRPTRYQSIDPAVIDRQLTLIKAAGGSGVRVTWQGPQNAYLHQAAMEFCNQCASKQMLFCLLINPQVNGQAYWWNDPGFLAMTSSPAYIPEKYVCDFSTGIDYSKTPLPAGFSVLRNQVGFGWINAQNPADNVKALTELQNNNKQPAMRWPFLSNGFFNGGFPATQGRDWNHEVWNVANPVRVIEPEAGNFFHDCVAALSLCPNAPYVGMVWNDVDENAGIEHFMSAYCGLRLGK